MLLHACPACVGMVAPWLIVLYVNEDDAVLAKSPRVCKAQWDSGRSFEAGSICHHAMLICQGLDPPGFLQSGIRVMLPRKERRSFISFQNRLTPTGESGQVTGLTCSPLLDRCLTKPFCTPLICDDAS